MKETERKSKTIATRVWSIALVILFVVCLLIVLWVVMVLTRFIMGLG